MRIVLRVAIGALVAAVVGIAMIPLLVLRNLNSGGTGWGLCDDGLGGCTNSYFAGFELVAALALALVLVLIMLRIATRTLRLVEHRYDRSRAATSVAPTRPVVERVNAPQRGAPGPAGRDEAVSSPEVRR